MRKTHTSIYRPVVVIVVICLSFFAILALFQFYHYRTKQLIENKANALWLLNGWERLQSTTKDLLITDELQTTCTIWTQTIDTFDAKIHGFISSEATAKISLKEPAFRSRVKETENLWRVLKPRMEYARDQFVNYLSYGDQDRRADNRSLLHELLFQMDQHDRSMDYMVMFDLTYDVQYMVSSLNAYFVTVLTDTVEHIVAVLERESQQLRNSAFLAVFVIMGITVVFIIISQRTLASSNAQLKFLSNQLIQAEEKERKRITYDLHDEIGQALTAIKFASENALVLSRQGNSADCISALDKTVCLVQHAIAESRKMSVTLRPAMIDQLGILATISWFTREYQQLYADIAITKDILVEEKDIPEPLKIVLYRLLQEALNNIAKHSGADAVTIRLYKNKRRIQLTVKDNGKGFSLETILQLKQSSGGLGLLTMRERVELTGGTLTIKSSQSGTSIHAAWPV